MTDVLSWGLDNPEKADNPRNKLSHVAAYYAHLSWRNLGESPPKVGDLIILYRLRAGDIKRVQVTSVEQRLCPDSKQVETCMEVSNDKTFQPYMVASDDLWIPDTLPKEQ